MKPFMPPLSAYNDTTTVTTLSRNFKSPRKVEVPTDIDKKFFLRVGLGLHFTVDSSNRTTEPGQEILKKIF